MVEEAEVPLKLGLVRPLLLISSWYFFSVNIAFGYERFTSCNWNGT